MELQINEIREIDGIKVKCVEDEKQMKLYCFSECVLMRKCKLVECRAKKRKDKRHVHYIAV